MKFHKTFHYIVLPFLCVGIGAIFGLSYIKAELVKTKLALAETKSAMFKMSGVIWKDFAPVNEWSEEIPINGHPFHLWTGNHHRHYQMMINDEIYPKVFEEGESPDLPGDIQTIRLMTVDGDESIFFEVPGY